MNQPRDIEPERTLTMDDKRPTEDVLNVEADFDDDDFDDDCCFCSDEPVTG